MLIFNKAASSEEFAVFATNVATALKEMKLAGHDQATMADVMTWLGTDQDDIEDSAWAETFELEDTLLILDVDRIVAGITDQLH